MGCERQGLEWSFSSLRPQKAVIALPGKETRKESREAPEAVTGVVVACGEGWTELGAGDAWLLS